MFRRPGICRRGSCRSEPGRRANLQICPPPRFASARSSATNTGSPKHKEGLRMRKKTLMVAVIGALTAGALVGGATIALAQADVVKQRQENRKETAATMR